MDLATVSATDKSKQAKAPAIPVTHNASTLAPLPAQQPIDPKIKKVASDFETMVIGQLLAPMFEALDTNGPFGGGSAEAMFRPMLVDEYAKSMSKAGGIGIADDVAREIMRLQSSSAAPQAAASGVAAAATTAKAASLAATAAAATALTEEKSDGAGR